MTGVSGVSSASGNASVSSQEAGGWGQQNLEPTQGQGNGWRTESASGTQAAQPQRDSASIVLEKMVGRMSIEMVKQQNPTQNKFSINNDD